jgi:two-component system, chemotaxis family, protein-glutamate methylesterase/glutaminase
LSCSWGSTSGSGPAGGGRVDAADLVVVGASAGGVGALQELVSRLAPTTQAAILVVLHLPTTAVSVLADILRRATSIDVEAATDGMPLRRGQILVAPPDRHLLVDAAVVRLARTARINRHRPAIDALFKSAARSFGPRVLGALLSGTLDDGVAGLAAIREAGGVTAVQDPDEAAHSGMPCAAIDAGVVDHVLTLAAISKAVSATAATDLDDLTPRPPDDGPAQLDEAGANS